MVHENIIKRSDGSRINIRIDLYVSWGYQQEVRWDLTIQYCSPRKRKFKTVDVSNDYQYRRLNIEDRKAFEFAKYLEYVTAEEILEAKLELWNKLKPTL